MKIILSLLLALSLVLIGFYQTLDPLVSGWFYQDGAGFYLKDLPLLKFLRKGFPEIVHYPQTF